MLWTHRPSGMLAPAQPPASPPPASPKCPTCGQSVGFSLLYQHRLWTCGHREDLNCRQCRITACTVCGCGDEKT